MTQNTARASAWIIVPVCALMNLLDLPHAHAQSIAPEEAIQAAQTFLQIGQGLSPESFGRKLEKGCDNQGLGLGRQYRQMDRGSGHFQQVLLARSYRRVQAAGGCPESVGHSRNTAERFVMLEHNLHAWFPLWTYPPTTKTAPRVRTEYSQDEDTPPEDRLSRTN